MNLNLVSGLLTLLSIVVGGACIMLIVSTKTLRDSRDDQEKRIKFLEDERGRDKATIDSLRIANQVLTNTVTGAEKLAEIGDLLNTHHNEALANWEHVAESLAAVNKSLTAVNAALERLIRTIGEKKS